MSSENSPKAPDCIASTAMTESAPSLESEQTAADPPTSFLSLPGELRNKIYELSLVQRREIRPRLYPHNRVLTIGLLRASKTVHREASAIFYGRNCFDFSYTHHEWADWFLGRIGKNNASYIRDVVIDFPVFLRRKRFEVSRAEIPMSILEPLRRGCENLMKITIELDTTDGVEERLYCCNFKFACEVLALVDARFRSIPSIQEIIVEAYDPAPSDRIRETMESYGWVIRTTKRYEEFPYCDFEAGDFGGSESLP